MTFNIEQEELTEYGKLDVPLPAFEIAYNNARRYLSDTMDENTDAIFQNQIDIFYEETGITVDAPKDALDKYMIKHGLRAPDMLRQIESEHGINGKQWVYSLAVNDFYAKMYSFKNKPEYKNNSFIQDFVTSDEELKNMLADQSMNHQYAAMLLEDNDYKNGWDQFFGSTRAHLGDKPMMLYMASLPLLATPIGMMSSALLRIAAWTAEGALGGVIIEGHAQKTARKYKEAIDLRITNPAVQKELERFGVDWKNLGITEEELNQRIETVFLMGALFGGTVGIISEGVRRLVNTTMAGDKAARQQILDLSQEIQTTGMNDEIIQNLSKTELVEHFRKIIKASNDVNFNKTYMPASTALIKPIKNIPNAIKEIETKLLKEGESLTPKQTRTLEGLMKYNNYSVEFHNSIINNQLLKRPVDGGDWVLRLDALSADDVLKNADEILTNFKRIQTDSANEKWFMSTLMGKKSGLRNFLDKDEYLKNLSKNKNERNQQILDDLALVNLLNGVMTQYLKFPTRGIGKIVGRGKKQSMQKIITDVLEVSYGRDILPKNIVSVQRATRQDFMNRLDIEALHTTKIKDINKFHGHNIIREIFEKGSTTDTKAALLAKQLTLMFDDIHNVASKNGMTWDKLNNFFPQTHVSHKVGKVSQEQWIDDIFPELNKTRTAKMYDIDPDDSNLDVLLREKLAEAYDNILHGDTKSAFANVDEGFKLRLKNAHSRVLFFKDADSWLRYNKQYGKDILVSLDDYMDHASMEIAMLRIFGPNPIRNAKRLEKFARDFDAKAKITDSKNNQFSRMFDHLSGSEFAIDGQGLAKLASETRALLVTAQLGGAYIMTLVDLSYGALTRMLNGMPAHKTLNNYIRFISGSKNSKALAREARVVSHEIGDELKNASRFSGEKFDTGYMSWASNKLMKVSLLAPGTAAARTAFKFEFQFHLKKLSKRTYDDAIRDKNIAYMYKRYGITKADHQALSKTKLYTSKYDSKVEYLRVGDIQDQAIRHKWYAYMFAETESSVPTMMARSRAFMMGGTRPGTGIGEVTRSFWLFKNFPMTIIFSQIARATNVMMTHPSHAARVAYPLGLITFTTFLGTFAYQLKNILKGEDPAPMNASTLAKGLMHGGGTGFYGDILLNDTSQYGRSTVGAVLGPVAGLINDLSKLGLTPVHNALYRNKNSLDKVTPQLAHLLGKYTPFNQLWYTRYAAHSLIFDNLKKHVDPQYNEKKKRHLKKLQKEHRGKWAGENFSIERSPKWGNIKSWQPVKD
tara:strand:- start:60 stop:3830 length:3771 start_codon:yes stop_codon:yes gene_type:complete